MAEGGEGGEGRSEGRNEGEFVVKFIRGKRPRSRYERAVEEEVKKATVEKE